MTFWNPILLAGAAAFSIPLIIHLFNRRKFRVVNWGAMHLLETVIRINKKRIQLEQLILLIIRCLIPAILALCLARPVVNNWRTLIDWMLFPLIALVLFACAWLMKGVARTVLACLCGVCVVYLLCSMLGLFSLLPDDITARAPSGDVRSSTVILLDNSYSMDAAQDGSTNFEKAKGITSQIINDLKRGSDISVIMMGDGAESMTDAPSSNRKTLVERIAGLTPGFGSVDTVDAIETGAGTLVEMSNVKRDLILVTDFQRANWQDVSESALSNMKRLANGSESRPHSVTLVHTGKTNPNNIAVENLVIEPRVVGVGQEVTIRADLVNHGSKTHEALYVEFLVDKQHKRSKTTRVFANDRVQVLFSHTFKTAGSHIVEVRLDTQDLEADNSFQYAIDVLEHIDVLLVNGDPSDQPLKGETDFLEVALSPHLWESHLGGEGNKLTDLLRATSIETVALDAEALKGKRVLALANVKKLTGGQVALVKSFVRNGGGLILFAGSNLDIKWYNEILGSDENELLPLPIESLAGSVEKRAHPARIVRQRFDHDALQVFNDEAHRNGRIDLTEFWMWYRLLPPQGEDAGEGLQVSVLTRMENGDPLIVEKRVGKGLVIQVATACDADWSNLPTQNGYAPLMQELAIHLATQINSPRNVTINQKIQAVLPAKWVGQSLAVFDPEGEEHRVQATASGAFAVVQFHETKRPGEYRLVTPDGVTRHFVVTTSRRESRLDQLTDDEIEKVAEKLDARVVRSLAEYREVDAQRRHGREIWKWLMIAVLTFLFAEMFLQHWFTRRIS